MVTPKVIVLMATYNGNVWLPTQLKSILNQKGVDVALIVSDDQSSDTTHDYLKKISELDDRVKVLPNIKKFGSAGMNFLRLLKDSDLSKVDYVAFSDQDDIWLENKLTKAINYIFENNVDGYSSNVTAFWSDGTKKLIFKSKPQQKYDYMFESAGPGCSFVFTQKLAIELQRFLSSNQEACKEVALHDWFTYAFAKSRGYNWHIDKESYVMYRQHEQNVLGANSGFKAKINRWNKMREGWYRDQVLILGNLLGYDSQFPITALKRYNLWDRLILILNVRKLRRRFRDCCALAIFFIFPLIK
jgi:rhamnosyltransferase